MRRSARNLSIVLTFAIGLAPIVALAADELAASRDLVRVVIELADPPLATAERAAPPSGEPASLIGSRTAKGHLDVAAASSRAYLDRLAVKQRAFERRLASAVRSLDVHWRYRTTFNGITAMIRRDDLGAVRALPGVVAVTQTYKLEPELDQSRSHLQLPTMWNAFPSSPLGPGAGLRVALIDSGVNPLHPFFSPNGYSAPAGYPKSEHVAGGARTPLPTPLYASNKVIVGNVYTAPDGAATPWGPGSHHGTHVAGIMAGNKGTHTYTIGGRTWNLELAGMVPGAYIMSYVPAGDSAEFLAAVEDVVADQADAVNISLGHSYWLTGDPVHDPLRKALEAAVTAGTIVSASAGNAGSNGDSTVTGSWKLSEKVITVASASHGRMFANSLSVAGPGTPPATLLDRTAVPAAVPAPPIVTPLTGEYVVAPGGTGPDAGLACTTLSPADVAGKIVLVQRGVCTFDVKKNSVRDAGGIAIVVYNNAPDLPSVMPMQAPAIPGVMVSQADGRRMVAWAKANDAPTLTIGGETKRVTDAPADVVSGFSSRGPSPLGTIKPDIAAPGFTVMSSVVEPNTGAVAPPLFDMLSGTSMSTPHVTALAAATKGLHPTWTPMQVKSAIMNTAHTQMFTDATRETPASARDRGAGRVRPARLVNPTLTFDPPSIAFGFVRAGETVTETITATDMRSRSGASSKAWSVRVLPLKGHARVAVVPTPSFSTAPGSSSSFTLSLRSTGDVPAGDYEGFVEVRSGSDTYTLPYLVRLQPADQKDVLLIDWDRNVGADFLPVYKAALSARSIGFDVFDGGTSSAAIGNPGPTLEQLQRYRTVVLFTGNNAASWSAAHVGGSFPLQTYLLGGGRLVLVGQDLQSQVAFNQNQGSDFLLTTMGGWISGRTAADTPQGCQQVKSDQNFYGELTPADALTTRIELLGAEIDASVPAGSNEPSDQKRPDAGRTVTAEDDDEPCVGLYNADGIGTHARVLGRYVETERNGVAIPRDEDAAATGVAPDVTLEQRTRRVPWTAAVFHVGIEGVNKEGNLLTGAGALGKLYDFVNDSVSVQIAQRRSGKTVAFVADADSSRGARIVKYRWSFGDGSEIVETTEPRTSHTFAEARAYTVRVEAVDALTRSGVGAATVDLRPAVLGGGQSRPGAMPPPAPRLPATEADGALAGGAFAGGGTAAGGAVKPPAVRPQPPVVLRPAPDRTASALATRSDAARDSSWVVVALALWIATASGAVHVGTSRARL